jgi:hypothetical protein
MASPSMTMPTAILEVQGRTFSALTRLLKVQLRLYIYTRKAEEEPEGTWGSLVRVESDFLVGAEREWSEVLGILDDPAHRTEVVNRFLGPACDAARESVIRKLREAIPEVDLIVQSFQPGVRVE